MSIFIKITYNKLMNILSKIHRIIIIVLNVVNNDFIKFYNILLLFLFKNIAFLFKNL